MKTQMPSDVVESPSDCAAVFWMKKPYWLRPAAVRASVFS